jgi:hypothetical protein
MNPRRKKGTPGRKMIQAQKMVSSSRHITGGVNTRPPLFSGLMVLAARTMRCQQFEGRVKVKRELGRGTDR